MSSDERADGIEGWEPGEGWGWIWGEDDEVGALNALGPDTVLDALDLVTEGRHYDLGVLMDRDSYLSPFHVGTEVVSYRTGPGMHAEGGEMFEEPGGVSYNTSMVTISDHAGTQIDGLCHATFGEDHHWYNGFTYEEHGRDFGVERAGAENIPPIIVSAVHVDVAEDQGVESLEAETAIGPEDLQSALDSQGTEIRPGDAVLIRGGVMAHWGETGADHEAIAGPDTAGITLEAAEWLVEEKGAIFIGADNSTVEVVPPVDGDNYAPVHKYLLVDQGVHMGELFDLEGLSQDGVGRCCLIALTQKLRGTAGGFALRPIALV